MPDVLRPLINYKPLEKQIFVVADDEPTFKSIRTAIDISIRLTWILHFDLVPKNTGDAEIACIISSYIFEFETAKFSRVPEEFRLRTYPTIVLLKQHNVGVAIAALKAGAIEVLLTSKDNVNVDDAIRCALAISSFNVRRSQMLSELGRRYGTLSRRELQVVRLVVLGKHNCEIAIELGITEITVKLHRHNVMKKMTAGSLAHLVGMMVEVDAEAASTSSNGHHPFLVPREEQLFSHYVCRSSRSKLVDASYR